MTFFLIELLICSVTMSLLALTYIAVTPFLAKRYSEKGRYYTWLIIVIGLIIPFRPQFDNPFVKVIPTDSIMPAIQIGSGMRPINPIADTILPAASPDMALPWQQIAAGVWMIGMMVFLSHRMIRHYRFMKMTSRFSGMITDEQTVRLLQSVKAELGISKDIGLYQSMSVGTPMLAGIIHPKIFLPGIDFATDELRFILHHELIHYKRKDLWYKYLVLLATAVHWFNPLIRFMAMAIDTQCEISCDSEVVSCTDADTRQQYSEAIIGVIRYQSKMKTTLTTNFYGGKKGMKKRIYSIMDTHNKKTGIAVLFGVLIFTLGTGYAFAAKEAANNGSEYIKEDIYVSPDSYKFLPDPDLYAAYSSYGVTISDDGKTLLYKWEKIRSFIDEYSDAETFYYDEAGKVNLAVTRNSSSEITGINTISEEAAQKHRSAFLDKDTMNETDTAVNKEADKIENKYEQYLPYGITYIAEQNIMYFNGQRVSLLVDEGDGLFNTFWVDEAGTVDLSVVRSSTSEMIQIDSISKEKAQDYIAAAKQYEQNAANGLEEKVDKRIKQLYQDKQ